MWAGSWITNLLFNLGIEGGLVLKSNHPPQNFPGPVAGIILGAGRSTRMGRTKQLLPWQGSTILGQVLGQARRSCLAPLIVVLVHDAERITQKVDLVGAKVVVNPDFARGQGTSLRAGLEGLPQGAEAALFLLGDQPLVTASVIDRILREYRSQKAGIIIPLYQGQRGNPVLIDRSLFPELMRLQGDTGARVLFEEHADLVREVAVAEQGVLQDIDTWEEYQKLA